MKIFALGDLQTVSCLRLAGVSGSVADGETVATRFRELLKRQDVGLIIITRELAELLPAELRQAELEQALPVLVEIPGIADGRGLSTAAWQGISQALGLPL
jgi:V/A-type H+-transporting ATPase subunit F